MYEIFSVIHLGIIVIGIIILIYSNVYNSLRTSFPNAVATIVRSGPTELFKGFVPSALRDAPYAGIFVAVYEKIKRKACEWTFFFQVFFFMSLPFWRGVLMLTYRVVV